MNFDLEDTRRSLIAMREKHGADTPAGHRCSNLIEQLQNYREADGEAKAQLAKNITRSMSDLAAMTEK